VIRQKLNLAATCITRPGMALTTCPKDVLPMLALTEVGPKNCAWLNVLKVSVFRGHRYPDSQNYAAPAPGLPRLKWPSGGRDLN